MRVPFLSRTLSEIAQPTRPQVADWFCLNTSLKVIQVTFTFTLLKEGTKQISSYPKGLIVSGQLNYIAVDKDRLELAFSLLKWHLKQWEMENN